ncbi:unnamed protein product [Caenorhabditis auriculariae]|uniref:Uncharacterized protein n=1 Tax=Caenorhabditis auriculariae TaxID=2777116 RepID=A0A8S1HPR2_9PELO|nr:unnamed protein product [Caenorhabditis auriculariae]
MRCPQHRVHGYCKQLSCRISAHGLTCYGIWMDILGIICLFGWCIIICGIYFLGWFGIRPKSVSKLYYELDVAPKAPNSLKNVTQK